jgi:hypothetical protein
MFYRSMSTCHRQTLPVSRNFVTRRCRPLLSLYLSEKPTHCEMLQEQEQTISIRSNVREWTHVLLANTPCSYLHRFCATGVISGLATRVTWLETHEGGLGEFITGGGGDLLLIWFLYRSTWWLLGCVLNGTLCILWHPVCWRNVSELHTNEIQLSQHFLHRCLCF